MMSDIAVSANDIIYFFIYEGHKEEMIAMLIGISCMSSCTLLTR